MSTLTPSVVISETGARTRLNGNIALPVLLYARSSSENTVRPTVDLTGSYEAISRFFFIDGGAQVSQQYFTPFGARPANEDSLTQNRYTAQSYRLSPYITGNTVNDLTYQLRDNNIWTKLGNGNVIPGGTTAYSNELTANVTKQPVPLGWTFEYSRSEVHFGGQDPFVSQVGRLRFIDRVDPQLEIYASGGYENNDYNFATTDDTGSSGTKSRGITYGAGATWHPTERTTVKGNWEHRFFGSSYLVDFEHRRPLSVWSFQASRDATTTPQQFASLPAGFETLPLVNQLFLSLIPDPVERQRAVDQFIRDRGLPTTLIGPVNLFSNQVYLAERAVASVALRGARNSIFFSIFRTRSRAITGSGTEFQGLLIDQQNITQNGVDISWTHNLSPSLVFSAGADLLRSTSQSTEGGHTNQGTFTASLSSPLSTKTSVSGGIRYQALRSSISDGFNEFAVFAGLNHTFR